MAEVTIALRYDLRSPEWAATPHDELYRTCIEQCVWADEHGAADIVSLSEHHGIDDGYLPAPFAMAAAITGATKRIPVTIAAALVPLHDPVRLAEQIAVLDLASGGRVSFVAGAGYKRSEFEMAGIAYKDRTALLERSIEVMRKAWTGEPFEWEGRTVVVRPVPTTKPHPLIMGGGSGPKAARRAARMRLPFFPGVGDPALKEAYEDECRAVGFENGFCVLPKGPGFLHVSEDPEKAWAEISRYAWYDADTYRSWQEGTRAEVLTAAADVDELRREGKYRVVTPDECVALAEELSPGGALVLHPLLCGMPAGLGWESLRLFKEKVLPRIRPAQT
ncbi:MAG: LLM class flavin-dependent oxidoreductase [Actinobacteria bacterium]|nr:MAG: LLM class flavin-dependent oxidoreductase [Actinomycetota bacterium]